MSTVQLTGSRASKLFEHIQCQTYLLRDYALGGLNYVLCPDDHEQNHVFRTISINTAASDLIIALAKVETVWTEGTHNSFNENEVITIFLLAMSRVKATLGIVCVSLLDLWHLFSMMYFVLRKDQLADSANIVALYTTLPILPGGRPVYPGLNYKRNIVGDIVFRDVTHF